jgi:hypothetical protein
VFGSGERFEGFAKKGAALSGRPRSPCRRAFTRLSFRCRSTLGHRPFVIATFGAGIRDGDPDTGHRFSA